VNGIKYVIQIVISVISFVWGVIGTPVKFVSEKIGRLLGWYKKLWIKFTHNKYEEFVYKKGAAMAAVTLAVLIIIPTVAGLIFKTTYYLATYKKESIYLIQSEEIYPDDNTWAVRGCYSKNCDSDSSLYYRIEPSLFHHLWSLGHNGNIFLPDTIGSSVPTGLTRCEVVSYGIRTRVLMSFHIYPSILKITCEGYGSMGKPNETGAAAQ